MSTQPLPLYLRRYQIDIALPDEVLTIASDEFEPNVLRVMFDIQQRAFQIFWTGEIVIFNLAQNTVHKIMEAAKWQDVNVTVQAGYKSSQQGYGIIWSGPIFQPLFTRPNVVDTVLTLHCILGLGDISRNFISRTYVAGITQADLAQKIADDAFTKIPVAKLSEKISDKALPRSRAIFGSPRKYLTAIAEENNMQWWLGQKGLTMSGLTDDDIPTTPSLTFKPPVLPVKFSTGVLLSTPGDGIIVGTPQQTPYGVYFRALIDSRCQVDKPFKLIKIDNTLIQQMKKFINPGQTPDISILDREGTYVVVGTRFVGDTRGNDWYVDVDGYTTTSAKIELMQSATYNSNGG